MKSEWIICGLLIRLALAAVSISGCSSDMDGLSSYTASRRTNVTFHASVTGMDGSAAEDAGDLLEDVSVFVYHDGKLAASSYSEGQDIPVMRLKSGLAYSIYAVANMGRCTPPEEESVLAGTEHFINGPDALGTGIVPMSAKGRVTVEGSHCRVDIPFVRLAAMTGFALESSVSYEIEYVALLNAPAVCAPFSDSSSADSVFSGRYYAGPDDVKVLGSGGVWYFSILENCLGVLLPDNTDPRQKKPSCLAPDTAGSCPYLEVSLNFQGTLGRRVYRFCLGNDATSDFNVRRNTYTKVTLVLGSGKDEYTWTVDRGKGHMPGVRFIAGGDSGNIVYTDGQGEVVRMKLGSRSWTDVVSSEKGTVLVGNGGNIAYSEDCRTWQLSDHGNIRFSGVDYGLGRYVAVGYNTASRSGNHGYIAVSENGMEWSVEEMPYCTWMDVVYGQGKFVVSGTTTYGHSFSCGRFMCSENCEEWQIIDATCRNYPYLAYGNGLFVAMDFGSCIHSADGVSWSPVEFTGLSGIKGLAYGSGTYVAVGSSGYIAVSQDSRDWTQVSVTGFGLESVSYGNGRFIASGRTGEILHSADGKEWDVFDTGLECRLGCACIIGR